MTKKVLLTFRRVSFDLQKMPFLYVTNALLQSNQASFLARFYNFLIFCWLEVFFLFLSYPLFVDDYIGFM